MQVPRFRDTRVVITMSEELDSTAPVAAKHFKITAGGIRMGVLRATIVKQNIVLMLAWTGARARARGGEEGRARRAYYSCALCDSDWMRGCTAM